MTPDVIKCWKAYSAQLSPNALHALLRALRGGEVIHDPLLYALTHGNGLPPEQAQIVLSRMQKKAEDALPTPHFGYPGGLEQVDAFPVWWCQTPHEERSAALASVIAGELTV